MQVIDLSDGELAARSLAGVETAFDTLVSRYREPLYRFVSGYIGDMDAALDIVQDSFAAAFFALKDYDRGRPFLPWLSRIALNRCRDWRRRRMVRRMFSFARPLDDALQVADPAAPPDVQAADRDRLRRAMQAIARLPDSLKVPLLLCAVEGLSQTEAAAMLGISEKAVELRVRRARAALAAVR